MPKKYIEKVGMDEFLKKPIGSGPYKFVLMGSFDDRVVLERIYGLFWWSTEMEGNSQSLLRAIPEKGSTRVGNY